MKLWTWIPQTAVALSLVCVSSASLAANMKANVQKSQLTWLGKKVLVDSKHNGTMKLKEGYLDLDKGQGKFVIDMSSINNLDLSGKDKAKLEGHLKSPDFFDVEKYPTATYLVKKVENKGNGQYQLHGDLTIKGKTEAISFPARLENKGKESKLTAKMEFDRSKFDVRFGSGKFTDPKTLGDRIISDTIEVGVVVVGQ
ncbi:MAG: YceI family protein [Oligoflexus sp.]